MAVALRKMLLQTTQTNFDKRGNRLGPEAGLPISVTPVSSNTVISNHGGIVVML